VLLLQVVQILTYLPRLDTAVRPTGKSGPVSGNCTDSLIFAPIDSNTIAESYFRIRVSPVNKSHNTAVKWCLHRRFRGLVATGEELKHTSALYSHKSRFTLRERTSSIHLAAASVSESIWRRRWKQESLPTPGIEARLPVRPARRLVTTCR
jgi:hypothetical protein